jgi:hypothetical protein
MRLKIFALWFCKFIIPLPYLHNEGVTSRQHNYIVYSIYLVMLTAPYFFILRCGLFQI